MVEPLNNSPVSQGYDIPSESDLYRCVHCGLCLSACPTYRTLKVETESPRGRIALMKAVKEERLPISDRVVSHWEMCLQCRACEAVCPSGVPYGRIMEYSRAQVFKLNKQGNNLKMISKYFLNAALPHPKRLLVGAYLIRLYQTSGFQTLLRTSRVLKLLPRKFESLETQLPVMGKKFFKPTETIFMAQGKAEHKVGLLAGCVMPLMQGETMRATVRVLNKNQCDVVVPVGQGCCGALNLHSGDLETAREMAKRNIDIFLKAEVDVIVTSSAGCGANMKEYCELLKNDPVYFQKAQVFSELTKDITEFLVNLPIKIPNSNIPRKITYQDPCHLAHAQRITSAPRQILKCIPGVQLIEMEDSSVCCGSAGIYSAIQPKVSNQILQDKLEKIADTNTQQVVTANPGCMAQIGSGLKSQQSTTTVCHVVDLLDEAYLAETVDKPENKAR